jgi:adenylate cyclase
MSSESEAQRGSTLPPPPLLSSVLPPPLDPPSSDAKPENHIDVSPRALLMRAAQSAQASIASAELDPRDAFEEQLAREILQTERFRATLLATIPSVLLFTLVIMRGAYPEVVASLFHGSFDLVPVAIFLMAVAGFEMLNLLWIRKLLAQRAVASASRRYAQAFVETSLPTVAVLYYATIDGPIQALLMPSVFVYFVFILLSTLRLDFALCSFTGLVAAGEYAAIMLLWGPRDAHVAEPALASVPHHLGKAFILLVSGVAAGFVAQRLRRSFKRALESVGERQRILGVFGQHVSPEIVERLVAGEAETRSEMRDVCVMFLDIRDFTAFSEERSPEEVVDFLNALFESTIDAVVSRHGVVNKFLGDGFMAIFGAPVAVGNSSAAAVDAALEIVARIERLVGEGRLPPTKVGIGLHAGKAIVGNIGSAQRKEYTVIGDVVNVASRIEALNKELGSCILASEEVWTACGRAETEGSPRDEIAIRGRSQAVRVWQVA